MVALAFFANGTGDEGDSISHYLYSRFAFEHPENFLNHWAKPVFVLLTAPIAQGGFTALKIFNIGLLLCSIWLMYKVGLDLKIPNVWIAVFVMIFAPMNISLTLSGLTEPLFAFWLMFGVYLFVKEKPIPAILWLSFLPFVRSEGLIVFCVLGIYILIKKYWHLLPLLSVGHIVYSIVGYFYYGDFLWIFNKMSYATPTSAYGKGPLNHFASNMHMVLGDFLPVLLIAGILAGAVKMYSYLFKKGHFSKDEMWLIYGIGVAYFIAHSLFWYWGAFNSFGLMRVMVGVLPLYALIIVQGINFLVGFISKNYHTHAHYTLIATMFVFLFLKLNYERDLEPKEIQVGQTILAEKYAEKYRDYTLFFDAPHIALEFDKDRFSAKEARHTPQIFTGEPLPEKSIIIWDSWFSRVDYRVELNQFLEDPRLTLIECVETGLSNPKKKSCLFELKPEFANQTVLMNEGFEQENSVIYLDSTFVKTGKYSRRVDTNKPYSKSFTGWINSFLHKKNPQLKVSASVYLPEGSSPKGHPALIVISYESAYRSFNFNQKPVFEEGDSFGWKKVTFSAPIPDYKLIKDKAKTYIYNSGKSPIFVDDFKVEWEFQ